MDWSVAAELAENSSSRKTEPGPNDVGQSTPAISPTTSILGLDTRPIDLDSALRLAGVRNPELMLARQRVTEAVALRQFAAAQLLPNINVGTNYDDHTGNLQQSTGGVLSVDRRALYAGLGAGAVGAGTVNIPGIVWDVQVSDTIYNNLISRQVVVQQGFAAEAAQNDVLLRVSQAYEELLRAEGAKAVAVKMRDDAQEVARLTAAYAKAGQGRKADADRAATELSRRQYDVTQAEGNILTAAAKLSQLLNLDPSLRLHPIDRAIVPAAIVCDNVSLKELIATALLQRPELKERQTVIREALLALDRARALPFAPTVLVGFSAGTFGGGNNLSPPEMGNFASRTDFDVVAYWTLRNLGVGNRALIREAASRVQSENYRMVQVLDQVRDEVAEAYARTRARFAQIGTSEQAVTTAQQAFTEDLTRIRGREGLPIEVLDSMRLLGQGRNDYLNAIIDYNRAQFELYVAMGEPPASALPRPAAAEHAPDSPPVPAPAEPVLTPPEDPRK
jgi:outer membrane protein TolC